MNNQDRERKIKKEQKLVTTGPQTDLPPSMLEIHWQLPEKGFPLLCKYISTNWFARFLLFFSSASFSFYIPTFSSRRERDRKREKRERRSRKAGPRAFPLPRNEARWPLRDSNGDAEILFSVEKKGQRGAESVRFITCSY